MSNKNTKRHGKIKLWAGRTSTVLSITLVLFVFGLLMFVEYHSYKVTHEMQERIAYQVDLASGTTEEESLALLEEIKTFDCVKDVEYISAEEAAMLFSNELDEDILTLLDSVNPLYPTLMVTFKAIEPAHMMDTRDTFVAKVKEYSLVDGVTYHESTLSDMSQIFYKLTWFLILFVVLLLIVSVALISTTIKIAIYNNRYTIRTMDMVGATTGFITRPFLWRSLLYGFLGALFATLMVAGSVYAFNQQFNLDLTNERHYIGYAVIAGALFVVGIFISFIATYFSVHRHLRSKTDQIG